MEKAQFKLITKPDDWSDCLADLRKEPILAVDLEANSMFAYRERVCLIQISTPTQDYIIDPLAGLDLTALGEIFADTEVEKIFHAAEYDLILMQRQYAWELNNLFDTMWAARILGHKRYGLANLLEDLFDVRLNKRYQKSNWCQRPLSPEQLAYACHDTHYLFQLRERLLAELEAENRLEEAKETFAENTTVTISDNGFHPDDFWSINGARDLSRQEQSVLKAINIYRDREAKRRDQPLFKILSDRTLLQIARNSPVTWSELEDVHGMSKGQMRRYGNGLLDAISKARQAAPPARPKRPPRTPEDVMLRYEMLHSWRKHRARARGVESDVIVSRNVLWELARHNPQTLDDLGQMETLGEWRSETYGPEILEVLHNSKS